MKHRLIAFFGSLLMLAAPAFAQQPNFTLPQLKAFVAMSPDAFRQEIKRQGFSYRDKTTTEWVSMIEYDKLAGDHTTNVMKSTYVESRADENSVQFSTTDKAVFDVLVKEARAAGYAPADKGRIPGGETYQEFKRKNEVVRFVYPKKESGMGLSSYTAVVWR
ncbi:hypothetical protein J2W30_000019 [Variovorax boronicumulans]|uniref:hypothetical protein n=1 Tax=Variovorax TaxID=34072 RepID=UPI00277D9ACD|nr:MULTISPECIES: hypothetical protein [Variovorax]MDQ0032278.1 hypothetical protein [Variovorax boronicumulans]MDQ0609929.1 hypothetical protein [Variovorax sp. W1I1]